MLRSHQNNEHASRLEYIVIWLLGVDCVLMLFQVSKALHSRSQHLGTSAYACTTACTHTLSKGRLHKDTQSTHKVAAAQGHA